MYIYIYIYTNNDYVLDKLLKILQYDYVRTL